MISLDLIKSQFADNEIHSLKNPRNKYANQLQQKSLLNEKLQTLHLRSMVLVNS